MKRTALTNARQSKNLSMEAVGQAVGVTKATISLIENGKSNPSWNLQKRLEQFFNIPASELLAEGEEETSSSKVL